MPPGKALSNRKTKLDQEHGKVGFVTRILWCDDDDCQTAAVRFQIVYDDDPDLCYPVLANVENLHFEAGGPEQVAILRDALVNLGYPPHEPTTLIIPRVYIDLQTSITMRGLNALLVDYAKYGPDRRLPTRANLLHADVETILGNSVDRTLGEYYLSEPEITALDQAIHSCVYAADPRNLAFPDDDHPHIVIPNLMTDILYLYGQHYVRDLLVHLHRLYPNESPPTIRTYHWEVDEGYMMGATSNTELVIEFRGYSATLSECTDRIFDVRRGEYVPTNLGDASPTIHPIYL